MTEIRVRASRPYSVRIGGGLLPRCGELAAPLIEGRRAVVCAGENVFPLYGETVLKSLREAGFEAFACVYPAGEEVKTPETLVYIINKLAELGLTRADAVFALGGGVTGDMAGLAAALYRRGIACVLLPTTLLAAADASVGGKTAVDLPGGKNQMGVFSQPRLVLCDTETFRTLPREVLAEGWAEAVKCAFLREGPLQELLLGETPEERIEELVAECVKLKAGLVEADERDQGARRLLNFGHTVGHAIERCSGWRWHHGPAVAVGMAVMTRACAARGFCDAETLETLETLLRRFSLPLRCPYGAEELLAAAASDKKRAGERLTLVLPRRFGRCELVESDDRELGELLALGL
ncbi:MAG: 3-dehydroquinate synthase [Oscillospiraceae bacterium]|nr:3-dehydroquinate synthase [Oscillospiraceae bacterium]